MAHKPDSITAKSSGKSFTPHPEGQFVAVCCDVIDFGEKVEEFPGMPAKLSHKCGIVFRTGELGGDGKPIDVVREFTVSMNDKANLRKFLEAWRAKSYTDDQAEEGAPLEKLAGKGALVTIEHKTSGAGRTYANLIGISPIPKQMASIALPATGDYERPDYLLKRKEEYAEEAKRFRATVNAPKSTRNDDYEGFPEDTGSDDDLPF